MKLINCVRKLAGLWPTRIAPCYSLRHSVHAAGRSRVCRTRLTGVSRRGSGRRGEGGTALPLIRIVFITERHHAHNPAVFCPRWIALNERPDAPNRQREEDERRTNGANRSVLDRAVVTCNRDNNASYKNDSHNYYDDNLTAQCRWELLLTPRACASRDRRWYSTIRYRARPNALPYQLLCEAGFKFSAGCLLNMR